MSPRLPISVEKSPDIATHRGSDRRLLGRSVGRTILPFCPKGVHRSLTGAGGSHNICAIMHMSQGQIEFRRRLRQLAVIGDITRLRLLRLLRGRELCVCELMDILQLPQYAVSRHLRVLRAAGLVRARRSGRWMHYRLGPMARRGQGVSRLVDSLCQELGGVPDGRRDDARLAQRLRLRRSGVCVVGITGPCKSNANRVLRGGASTKLRRGLAADPKI